jgi:hypothetical protein
MSMLDSLNLTNTIGGGGGSSSVSPIKVIKRNGGVNGDFAKGNIKPIIPILKTIGVHWDIGGDKLKILSEAQAPH